MKYWMVSSWSSRLFSGIIRAETHDEAMLKAIGSVSDQGYTTAIEVDPCAVFTPKPFEQPYRLGRCNMLVVLDKNGREYKICNNIKEAQELIKSLNTTT